MEGEVVWVKRQGLGLGSAAWLGLVIRFDVFVCEAPVNNGPQSFSCFQANMSALGLDCGTGETKILHFKQTAKGVEITELGKLDCLESLYAGGEEGANKIKKMVREAIEKVGAIFKIFPVVLPPPLSPLFLFSLP